MNATLFQRILGAEFYHLAPQVRALHARQGRFVYAGQVSIERGGGLLARLAGAFARLAPAMREAPIRVEFEAAPDRETWRRDFAGHPLTSTLSLRDGRLRERIGLLQFEFRLHRNGDALHWAACGGRVLGVLPLPARVLEDVRCREAERDGRYTFLVDARLPLVGRLIRYEGWLERVE